jgi:hypothetical protein
MKTLFRDFLLTRKEKNNFFPLRENVAGEKKLDLQKMEMKSE